MAIMMTIMMTIMMMIMMMTMTTIMMMIMTTIDDGPPPTSVPSRAVSQKELAARLGGRTWHDIVIIIIVADNTSSLSSSYLA